MVSVEIKCEYSRITFGTDNMEIYFYQVYEEVEWSPLHLDKGAKLKNGAKSI